MKFNLVKFDEQEESNLTVFIDGEMYTATNTHPNFARIMELVLLDDEDVVELFDIEKTVQRRFQRLSERVTVSSGKVYFDGEEVNSALTRQVLRFVDEGVEDFAPLVAFLEKVETNPNEHSREQLYVWLKDRDFSLTHDGNFVAYKGVRQVDDGDEVVYESISRGKAVSNGVEYNGAIPNPVGAVVEMPRSEVQHDPGVGCHTGLHAGTWEYASGFSQGAVLTVEINPRDVVSVPTDCSAQKLRTCRYTVRDVTASAHVTAVYAPVDEYDDYGYDDYDDDDPEAPWNQ